MINYRHLVVHIKTVCVSNTMVGFNIGVSNLYIRMYGLDKIKQLATAVAKASARDRRSEVSEPTDGTASDYASTSSS